MIEQIIKKAEETHNLEKEEIIQLLENDDSGSLSPNCHAELVSASIQNAITGKIPKQVRDDVIQNF